MRSMARWAEVTIPSTKGASAARANQTVSTGQQPFRQAEGESVQRQRVDGRMILRWQRRARVVERGANGSFVQSFDQQERGEGSVIAAHTLLAGPDRGFCGIGEEDARGDDAVKLRKFGGERG